MAKWIFLSTPCLTCLVFLAAAALSRQVRPAPAAAPDPFLAQTSPTNHNDAASAHDAKQVFERVCNSLRQVQWLKTTIWQRFHAAADGYESEAKLVLGPDQCARMDATIRTAAGSSRVLTVCDGRIFAEVVHYGDDSPKVTSGYLPGAEELASREYVLRKHGCAGPLPLLTELRTKVPEWRVEAGVWRQQKVLRLEGAVAPKSSKTAALGVQAARFCRLYCDASSLLPLRLEWYADDQPKHARLLLELEYRGLQLDSPLTPDECARVFTYDPRVP